MKLNKDKLNDNKGNRRRLVYLLVGTVAFSIRLYINFSQDLIPGVNGGYYPLQVRSILTNGVPGFSDMPLLFYLDAFIIQLISWLGFSITDTLILNVVKIVDSISIPILLFPMYKFIRLSLSKPSLLVEGSIISFVVLSFSPQILTSDLQKNALAITFLVSFISYLAIFQSHRKKAEISLAVLFLILTGLTHFGTFIYAMSFLVFILGYVYKRKAAVPLLMIIIPGLVIIGVFDVTRLIRLVSVGSLIFEKPAMIHGMLSPSDYILILFSIILAIIGIRVLISKRDILNISQRGFLFASILSLVIFSIPFLDGEYFKRLSLFLFIPQTLLIILITPHIRINLVKTICVSLLILTSISLIAVFGHSKETVIDDKVYAELNKLNLVIKPDNETIIIARHGLEWWTAWALKTKVAQDKAMDSDLYEKYKNIIILNQVKGFTRDEHQTLFHEPFVPQDSELLYSSVYFKLFKLIKTP